MSARCDLCNKFTRQEDLMGMAGEYEEYWFECIRCMSNNDLFEHFYRTVRDEQ